MTALTGQAQMQQGETTALAIKRGPAGLNKPVMQIEPDRFGVLLIHIHRHVATRPTGMIQQRAANPSPSQIRLDEEHFHVAFIEPDKPERSALDIDRHPQLNGRQVSITDLRQQGRYIGCLQEQVRGANRAQPNAEQVRMVGVSRLTNGHDLFTPDIGRHLRDQSAAERGRVMTRGDAPN